jgi:cation diffusion facilitator CzcD-associated flavoprotein CzcO
MNGVAPQEAIVIGGGQSGLAAAWALQRRGVTPVVLEAGEEPVGSRSISSRISQPQIDGASR